MVRCLGASDTVVCSTNRAQQRKEANRLHPEPLMSLFAILSSFFLHHPRPMDTDRRHTHRQTGYDASTNTWETSPIAWATNSRAMRFASQRGLYLCCRVSFMTSGCVCGWVGERLSQHQPPSSKYIHTHTQSRSIIPVVLPVERPRVAVAGEVNQGHLRGLLGEVEGQREVAEHRVPRVGLGRPSWGCGGGVDRRGG